MCGNTKHMIQKLRKRFSLLYLCLVLGTIQISAQVSAIVNLSRKSVYLQQPFRVTITVYTRTWFTQPVEFTNLQIPNAFIVPFDQTQPGMFAINGKSYPGIQFYYIVFPYKTGKFTVPSLEITAQSPKEGSSESHKVVIHTQEESYTVKDIPKELKNKGNWFVAKNVRVNENWSPSLENLKVGDVIKRTVTVTAHGTLPQFIPDFSGQETVNWASAYPDSPVLLDMRTGGDVNGKSTQTTTFLLEKEGKFTLPVIHIPYWNPYTGKINEYESIPKEITVAENPNLGILKTLKDSLNVNMGSNPEKSQNKAPFLIWGMKWYQFAGLSVLGIIVIGLMISGIKKLIQKIKILKKRYLKSERYMFMRFILSKDAPRPFLQNLYKWWDTLRNKPSASISHSLKEYEEKDMEKCFKEYMGDTYSNKNPENAKKLKKAMRELRKKN